MNCAEKLVETTIFFNLYTKSPKTLGSEISWRKRDHPETWCTVWYGLGVKFDENILAIT